MKKLFAALVFLLLGGIAFLAWQTMRPAPAPSLAFSGSEVLPDSDNEGNASAIPPPAPGVDPVAHARKVFIEQLKRQYGQRLDNPYWQLKMLEFLMDYLKKQYPDDWESRLEDILRAAFPELAERLLGKARALIDYLAWVDALEHDMKFDNEADRRKALWEKRVALFGEEAYIIWEAAWKDEQFNERMQQLTESTGTFSEKVAQYSDSLKEVFGDNLLSQAGAHKTQIMGKFLELPNVQADLRGMSAEDRRMELRSFRQAMGLDEAALERWESLDQERDQEWTTGQRYVQERERLRQTLQGEALTKAMNTLQNQLFGKEQAQFIRNEEAAGFCRYCEERIHGYN